MSSLLDPARRHPLLTRRWLLKSGTAGVLGWSLPQLFALEAQGAPGRSGSPSSAASSAAASSAASHNGRGRAKRVLVILEQGGLSHIDTWDPNPRPSPTSQPRTPISTSVPGIQFTSLLRTLRGSPQAAVVRSCITQAGAAYPNGAVALSGSHPQAPLEIPDIGSVVSRLLGSENAALPPYIMVPAITSRRP